MTGDELIEKVRKRMCCTRECAYPKNCRADINVGEAEARAAILAVLEGIREPSEEMKLAGARSIDRPMWQAMIDAALKEGK